MRVIDQGCLEESIMGKKKKRQILPKIGENRKVSENRTDSISEESSLTSADASDVQINGKWFFRQITDAIYIFSSIF